jgi:hypothetical protein
MPVLVNRGLAYLINLIGMTIESEAAFCDIWLSQGLHAILRIPERLRKYSLAIGISES